MQNVVHGLSSNTRPVDTTQSLDSSTRTFYRVNAANYFERTFHVKMDHLYSPFLAEVGRQGRILDVGCGSGRDVKAFRAMGYEAFGVDSSPELVKLAYENVGPYFREASIESLKVDAPYDGVWACASLLHLARSKIALALQNLKGTLKLEGVLFATVQRGAGEGRLSDSRYYTYYGTQEFCDSVESAGFSIISAWETADSLRAVGGPTWINVLARRTQP